MRSVHVNFDRVTEVANAGVLAILPFVGRSLLNELNFTEFVHEHVQVRPKIAKSDRD